MDEQTFRRATICGIVGTPSDAFVQTGANNVYHNLQTYFDLTPVFDAIAIASESDELSEQERIREIQTQTLPYLRKEFARGIKLFEQGITMAHWLQRHNAITTYERSVAPRRLFSVSRAVDRQIQSVEAIIAKQLETVRGAQQ